MDKIYWSTGQFMLGSLVGTVAIAVFAVSIQLQQMYMMFSTSISGVFLPRVTAMISNQSSKKEISDLFIKTGRFQYIVMSFILSSFILFGKYFVVLWAGQDYEEAYIIALFFFIPLTVPLIQNLGIVILQARNQLKFRSVMYIIIAILSLFLQIPLIKLYGAIGSAIAISLALIIGQIIIMNIYYYKKQGLNIPKFWSEILSMSFVPFAISIISFFIISSYNPVTISKLLFSGFIFSVTYIIFFWNFSMNKYEKNIFSQTFKKFVKI
jgi:O-antigen/teichoic acid export membrane protein